MEILVKEKFAKTGIALADSTYNGLFVRSALNQVNTLPRRGAQSSSPDIIPVGIEPVTDPQKYFKDTYGSDVGKKLEANKSNYVYLRAKNFSDKRIEDNTDGNRPRLFWTKASVLSYPSEWTEIKETGSGKPAAMSADAGAIGVIDEPMIWVPKNITGNDHYCMIGLVPSPGYDNQIPNTLQISDFAGWVAKNGGVAWRNVEVVNSNTLTLTTQVHYDQGTEAAAVLFNLRCDYVPKGSSVSFSAGTPGPNPAIYLPETPVTNYPSFTTGVICTVPENYVTEIRINVTAPPGVTDLPNAKVTIEATYATPPGSKYFHLGHTLAELGILTPEHAYGMILMEMEKTGGKTGMTAGIEMYLDQLSDIYAKAGPTRPIIVGATTVAWK